MGMILLKNGADVIPDVLYKEISSVCMEEDGQ